MGIAAVISFCLIFAAANNIAECQQKVSPLPAFCNRIDCPRYEAVEIYKVDDRIIEERKYVTTSWISTTMEGLDFKPAKRAMFWKLFMYIRGNNMEKTKINMTVPVKTRIVPEQGVANFTMSFFVSPDQEPAPEPIDKSIRIEKEDSLTFFVTHFGGFANIYSWKEHAIKLGADLKRLKLSFEEDHYFVCGYDAPFKRFNRHNEVWFLKK